MIKVKILNQSNIPITVKTAKAVDVEAGKSISYIANVDYKALKNKPTINNCVLDGNLCCEDIGIKGISNQDILDIYKMA